MSQRPEILYTMILIPLWEFQMNRNSQSVGLRETQLYLQRSNAYKGKLIFWNIRDSSNMLYKSVYCSINFYTVLKSSIMFGNVLEVDGIF